MKIYDVRNDDNYIVKKLPLDSNLDAKIALICTIVPKSNPSILHFRSTTQRIACELLIEAKPRCHA